MGIHDLKKAPTLPAPTETDSLTTPTELATEVSRLPDEKSFYSLPDDGTPVTIQRHKANKSQTSLLIEYFEGSKSPGSPDAGASSSNRRPSVRVRLTPSKTRGKDSHIKITETKSRKASLTRRGTTNPTGNGSEGDLVDPDDARSMNSYASATEESNVSRHPIEVDIDQSQSRRRNRKVSSPLIPAADSKLSSYNPGNVSDISAIPPDSFLDGSGGTTTFSREERRSKSPTKREALAAAALGGVATAAVTDKLNRSKYRSDSHDRKVIEKAVEKAGKSERRQKSKSRTSSISEKDVEHRRRSRGSHKESLVSAADSSILLSQMTPSHRSYDSHSSSKVSINNPKLLETVEDAIRRLILPELDAIKRERSQRETRKSNARDSLSSLTSASREELSGTSRRKSVDTTYSTKSRGREARNDLSPRSSVDHASVVESVQDEDSPRRGKDRFGDTAFLGGAAAAGAALGADVAGRERSRTDENRQRRRRRAKTPERRSAREEYDEVEHEVIPPMPLSSEINPSEITRTSIMSADTDRPHSASEEMMSVHEVNRGVASIESFHDTPTPTRTPTTTLQGLGTQHANISHGDLKALPRRGPGDYEEDYEDSKLSQLYPHDPHGRDEYDEEYNETGHLAEPGMYDDAESEQGGFYGTQDVPAPLRYVPYQQERRGLSPIQSVSGYTEGDSEINHHHRDSRATQSEFFSPGKSPHHERGFSSPGSVPSNMRSHEFGDEESSLRSSNHYRNTTYTDDSELDRVQSGQAVRGLGANPEFVDSPLGAESHVASLVDGSVPDPSLLSSGQEYRDSQLSYNESARNLGSRGTSLEKLSVKSQRELIEEREREQSPALSRQTRSNPSREFSESEIDEYGNIVVRPKTRHSPSVTASEAEIIAGGLAAAAALKAKNNSHHNPSIESVDEEQFTGEGVSRNRSFKERAKNGYKPNATPRHSYDRLSEDFDHPQMGASGLPEVDHPMPEIGYGYDDEQHHKSPSIVQGPLGGSQHGSHEYSQHGSREYSQHGSHEYSQHGNHEYWEEQYTPTQERTYDFDRAVTPKASEKGSKHGLGIAAAAATLATAGALVASHSRQPSQEQEDDWHRTSGERKRDTLVTNPYEDISPIANLPGLDGNMLGATGFGTDAYQRGFHTGSPGMRSPGMPGDEGYISAAPNEARAAEDMAKSIALLDQSGLGGNLDDPFYAPTTMPKNTRHLSGMSQAMGSPLYDAATGTGIDRIQSKDIIALMEHLMVRDAQRSARDTDILMTLVQTATEMRTSFDTMRRLLVDSEDQIISEVKDNTEKTVQRHIGGPRPFPGSARASFQGGSQVGSALDDMPAKKRNLFRRALKGLSSKGANDLTRIEDMLMQLLGDVDELKHQQGAPAGMSRQIQSSENIQHDMQDEQEQDRGYEPEGNAGTSTASHASQSGHLSLPQSRGNSTKAGYERKFSDHRISTVQEDEEGEYDNPPLTAADQYSNRDLLMSAAIAPARGSSVPMGTPPQSAARATKESLSNDNTPLTDTSKKHKSRGSSSFFPKMSRWSETTTSSFGKVFRGSGNSRKQEGQPEEFLHHQPSRSGSDLNDYENCEVLDPYGEDKLHSGLSEQDLPVNSVPEQSGTSARYEHHDAPPSAMLMIPEDPKYKAHRNSLNLQHPQPRPGQTERFRTALESSAQEFDSPMSPGSGTWDGSATSLNRFPGQSNERYSDQSAADEYKQYNPTLSPAAQGPPRPPKEPLDTSTPPRNERINKLQKKPVGGSSPLPYHSVESGYGTATHTAPSYHSGSPRLENRNLSGALGVPGRRPSGPRAMTPTRELNRSRGSEDDQSVRSASGEHAREERRRKRDTFGTIASQKSETF